MTILEVVALLHGLVWIFSIAFMAISQGDQSYWWSYRTRARLLLFSIGFGWLWPIILLTMGLVALGKGVVKTVRAAELVGSKPEIGEGQLSIADDERGRLSKPKR